MDTLRDDYNDNTRANTIPAESTEGHHESDGTLGEVAGTGSGALSGGIVGGAIGGPVGAVIGAVAGGILGSAAGEAAHKIGDDHDDVNVVTDSEGSLGREAGTGAGAISGAVVGSAAGPVGTVAGAVAGGVLGAAAGDAAKHVGENDSTHNAHADHVHAIDGTTTTTGVHPSLVETPGNGVPGVQTGGTAYDGTPDTRGISEKAADAVTGDRYDDKTGKPIV
jgi:outer membrane lipoprotein SlyB